MRVALVCGDFRPDRDGVAHYTARLAEELQDRGMEVVIATLRPPGNGLGAPGATMDGVQMLGATDRWDLWGVVRLGRTLRPLDADVVHVQFAPSAFGWDGAIGLLPTLLGRHKRLITTLHEYGWWAWAPHWATPLLARTAWPLLERMRCWDRETGLLTTRAEAVVITNAAHLAALRRRIPHVRARLVPIGSNLRPARLDRDATCTAVREQFGVPLDAPVLAFFGFIHAVKGIRHLLQATARLRRQHRDLRLLLIGGFESLALPGPEAAAYEAEIRGMIRDQRLDRAVTITGWLPEEEVSRLLTAADVAVLPFTAGTTTKSGALLACAEHGLPIVCTAVTPPDPALVDGETAVLVATRDSGSLADGVARILDDPTLRARLAQGAARISAAHGWGAIADAHLEIYGAAGAAPAVTRHTVR